MSNIRKIQKIIRKQTRKFQIRICNVTKNPIYEEVHVLNIDPLRGTWSRDEIHSFPDGECQYTHVGKESGEIFQISNADIRHWLQRYGLNFYRALRHGLSNSFIMHYW